MDNFHYVTSLLAKHRASGAIVDTNLVLLYVVGSYRPDRIEKFKRTRQYTGEDFRLLAAILSRIDRRITTPNIITESDNLCRQLPADEHDAVAIVFARLFATFFEMYMPTGNVVNGHLYPRLGITDSVTLGLAENRLVITDDFMLANRISAAGGDAININHIRRFT